MYNVLQDRRPTHEERAPDPVNDPKLFTPTRVKVVRAFFLRADKIAEPGEVVVLPKHDALSLRGAGKCVLVDD
jgi:hypothetical protein